MTHTPVALDEILDALPTREIARRLACLSATGPGTLKGCCPLHIERTPSFEVRYLDRPGRFHRVQCRGCGFSGDAVDLMAAVEGVSRAALLAELPGRLGLVRPATVVLPARDPDTDEF